MNKESRKLYGLTDDLWAASRSITNEAMIGGKVRYHSLTKADSPYNGKTATIVKPIRSTREVEIRFGDGTAYRAFGCNLVFL